VKAKTGTRSNCCRTWHYQPRTARFQTRRQFGIRAKPDPRKLCHYQVTHADQSSPEPAGAPLALLAPNTLTVYLPSPRARGDHQRSALPPRPRDQGSRDARRLKLQPANLSDRGRV